MRLYSVLHQITSDWRAARAEAQTRRIIARLPAEVRKDIGWPDMVSDRLARRTGSARAH